MSIKLYDFAKSGHCHRVRLAASLMKINLELVAVMEMEGQLKGADYLAINPLAQMPTLKEADFILRDSIAIIQHLERAHAPGKGWMPEGLQERAQVDEWFGIAAGVMFRGPNMARLIKLFGVPGDHQAAVSASESLFAMMDAHLSNRTWLVGEQASLADVACYSYIAVANEGELDLTPYPQINTWLKSVQSLDGFVDIPRS